MEEVEKLGQAMSAIRFPKMRDEVISAIRALADPGHQETVWRKREYPHDGYYDDFSTNIHILYDDTGVCEDPFGSIGLYLKSQAEAEAIARVAEALNELLEIEGAGRTDAEYLGSPHWHAVVRAASVARQALED
ncbi:SCO4402 family protein [Nonomuraea typhae]|uniref:SCO4402 family protein n=1 Tax=Nonomuraea typhae TaxID=2603600 RepID=UPI0012F9276F|nr:hypothetical protein [Nonomuraea typhae]